MAPTLNEEYDVVALVTTRYLLSYNSGFDLLGYLRLAATVEYPTT